MLTQYRKVMTRSELGWEEKKKGLVHFKREHLGDIRKNFEPQTLLNSLKMQNQAIPPCLKAIPCPLPQKSSCAPFKDLPLPLVTATRYLITSNS
jgi:hypothetical protein